MLKLLIKKLIVITVFVPVVVIFTSCSNNENEEPLGGNYVLPSFTYNISLVGYIFINCSKTPAAHYPLNLYGSFSDPNSYYGTVYTDNTGYYSIPYSYTYFEGQWSANQGNGSIFMPKDSILINNVFGNSLPASINHDSSVTINNFNIVIDDSAHFRTIFKFSKSYSNADTLYYSLNDIHLPLLIQKIVGPFPSRLVLNFAIPEKYLYINTNSAQYYFNNAIGWKTYNATFESPYVQNHENCSPLDSLVINY